MLPVEVSEWNRTAVDYARDSTIGELFSNQASLTPDGTAVIAMGRRLTYAELEQRSNRLARYLRAHGVRPETLVGVAMERSVDMPVALLAILKAGGAYLPLDPDHPNARLSFIIRDSGLSLVLTTEQVCSRLPGGEASLLNLETAAGEIALYRPDPLEPTASATSLAYVIYTSGSTGQPKGVMVEHRNVLNFFAGMDQVLGSPEGVWLAVTSISFDISILELLWTLTQGFQVVIHSDPDNQRIAREIAEYGVTHLQMTPSLARMLAMDERSLASLRSLKQLLLGGEALPASLVTRLRSIYSGDLLNLYGPTETTIWSTTYRVTEPGTLIPIGKPIANTQTYLLDQRFSPVPIGEPGELFIGGDGVVRGYWNRPELTAQKFLDDCFRPGRRLYRTGDLARYLPDGNLEFLGRADFQIKLRGFRIEPAEIEAILEQQPGVREAVVVAREDRAEDKRLVAYLTAEAGRMPSTSTLRATLVSQLPEYMIPSGFVFLETLPLTDNLKIDRNALLRLEAPHINAGCGMDSLENDVERTIAQAWQDALGVVTVGRDDNFFDLGAHSLTVAEVHSRLQQELKRDFPLLDLFQFPSVRALAAYLAGTVKQGPASDRAKRRLAARAR